MSTDKEVRPDGFACPYDGKDLPPLRGLSEVYSSQVRLRAGFWGPRLKTYGDVTVGHVLNRLEEAGHVTNFDKAAGTFAGELQGHAAFDSDLHKALEGAMFYLQNDGDEKLRRRVDAILDRVLAAQQEDGFLVAYWVVEGLEKRWEDLRLKHPMYNAGHFFEMAVEHHRLTGEPKALTAAQRFADNIDDTFGPGKRYDVDGHQEVELALVKLYRVTGERRYLELCRFFLDERGYEHGSERRPFDHTAHLAPVKPEGELEGDKRREFWHSQLRHRNGRMQDHKPILKVHEAVGHAVRAGYMYAAMTDLLRFTEHAPGYEQALDDIWEDVITRKMYITGGIGSGQYDDEGFGDPYLLPNETAYCESCAAIAHVLWQHRMALLKKHARYADVMELALYNGMLSGISISGDQFLYENHLSSREGEARRSWIGIACCPTNLARIIPQVGGLAYATGGNEVYVNLYLAGKANINVAGMGTVRISQETDYPWNGRVQLTIMPEEVCEFTLCLRIPGWALGRPVPGDLYSYGDPGPSAISITINGKTVDSAHKDDGYVHLQRRWEMGDVVELDIAMPVRRVYAHEKVKDDLDKVALMRGPVVYCIEAPDHPNVDILSLTLPSDAELRPELRPEFLGGITVLLSNAIDEEERPTPLTAIPCYAMANRDKCAMTVWIKRGKSH